MIFRKIVGHLTYDTSYLLIFLSFLIVSLAQPDWSPLFSVFTALGGYALFWKGIQPFSKSQKFFSSWLWMALIQGIQLSWLGTDHYLGSLIYGVLVLFALWVGLQFALLSLYVERSPLFGAALWTLLEGSRLFFLSGYTLNPVGLALTCYRESLQMAGLVGIYGLSFFVILLNLLLYQVRKGSFALFLLPYLGGALVLSFHDMQMAKAPKLRALLLQQAILPEEMNAGVWEKLLLLLEPFAKEPIDLLLLSETALPFPAKEALFPLPLVDTLFTKYLGRPTGLQEPYLSNLQISSALSSLLKTTVIVGVEDQRYNAAYSFSQGALGGRYCKQVLVPFGEYLPWGLGRLAEHLPTSLLLPGRKQTLLEGKYGLSICYEETFGYLIRKCKRQGATCLLNISNDVWYPQSRLCMVHYLHGRVRAVELGLPLLRACNTGFTCGVDATGRLVAALPYASSTRQAPAAVLSLSLPLYHFPTLYAYLGDYLIMGLSFFLLLLKKETIR